MGKEEVPAGQLGGEAGTGVPKIGCQALQGLTELCCKGSSASTVGPVSSSVAGEPMETSPVIHLVTDAKGTVIHEVHVQMQELPVGMKALAPEVGAALPFDHTVPGCVQQDQGEVVPPSQESTLSCGENS